MFNTDTTVPEWEKSPEQSKKDNLENAESQNAQAWAEAFPPEENDNPWLNVDMESEKPQLEDDTKPSMPDSDDNNELADTDNIVTNQLREVWNDGQGGQNLTDAYDNLRGSFTAENIKTSADTIETTVSDTVQENSGKDAGSEVNYAQSDENTPEALPEPDQNQVKSDLYNLTASAGATAIGAQASAEMATAQLMQDSENGGTDSTQQDLDDAKQTLEDIQSDITTIGTQAESGSSELQTAESALHDAQQMVIDAQQSLEEAKQQAEERQEFIKEHQEEIQDLQEQGVEMGEINQAITEDGNIDSLREENPPEKDDEFEPRQSIFG